MDVGRCTVSPSPPTDSLRPLPPPPPAAAAAAPSSRQRRPWPPPLPPPCRCRPCVLPALPPGPPPPQPPASAAPARCRRRRVRPPPPPPPASAAPGHLRSDCGSFHKLPGPYRGPGLGKTRVSLGCVRPLQGAPIGCSSPRASIEGSFRVWPSGSLHSRPRGVVPRYPPRGMLREWSRPVPGSCRGPCHP